MEKCIAAAATPIAPSGIAVVRLSGIDSIKIASKIFRPVKKNLEMLAGYSAAYGHIVEKEEIIDDGVALVFRAPNSYTGEDTVEISCHGGILIIEKVLELCYANGASPAQNGEFTKRAFLNNKMNLTQAEAVMDLINAQSVVALKAANAAKSGALCKKIDNICKNIVEIDGHIQAWLDYPDEDIDLVDSKNVAQELDMLKIELEKILKNYRLGNLVKSGVKTVIVGKPNVGKSTITNLLSGREKSIVTDISGTTRDIVESEIQIDGLAFILFDTAGIREAQDAIEKIGIERAKDKLEEADLILFIADGSQNIDKAELEFLRNYAKIPKICVLNKEDLGILEQKIKVDDFSCVVKTSCKKPATIENLKQKMLELMKLNSFDFSAPLIFNERQKIAIKKAIEDLQEAINAIENGLTWDAICVSIENAIDHLLELTGETSSERVIDEVFSKFCVGK